MAQNFWILNSQFTIYAVSTCVIANSVKIWCFHL